MSFSAKLNCVSALSYLLLTAWQHFSICGLQGVLLGSLQSTKFNFLFALVIAFWLLGKSAPSTDSIWQLGVGFICILPLVIVAVFSVRAITDYDAGKAATGRFFEESTHRWQSIYNALVGPGLLHGWVFIVSFTLVMLFWLPSLTGVSVTLESDNSSFYPFARSTRLMGLAIVTLFGFLTGAYWAFFSQAWGSWFNYDPVELVYLLMLLIVFALLHCQNPAQLVNYKFLGAMSGFSVFIYCLRFGLLDSKHAVTVSDLSLTALDKTGWCVWLSVLCVGCLVAYYARTWLAKIKTQRVGSIQKSLQRLNTPAKIATLSAIWVGTLNVCITLLLFCLATSCQVKATQFAWFSAWWLTALTFFMYSARTKARHLTAAAHKLWSSWHSVLALCLIPFSFFFTYLTFPIFPSATLASMRSPSPPGYSFLLNLELEGAHLFRSGTVKSAQSEFQKTFAKAGLAQGHNGLNLVWVSYDNLAGRSRLQTSVVSAAVVPYFSEASQISLSPLHPVNNHPLLIKVVNVEVYTQANNLEIDAIFSCFCWAVTIFWGLHILFL